MVNCAKDGSSSKRLFLGAWVVYWTRSPPTFFWQGGSSTERPEAEPKGVQRMGFAENTTEGSLEEHRKLKAEQDAFEIP